MKTIRLFMTLARAFMIRLNIFRSFMQQKTIESWSTANFLAETMWLARPSYDSSQRLHHQKPSRTNFMKTISSVLAALFLAPLVLNAESNDVRPTQSSGSVTGSVAVDDANIQYVGRWDAGKQGERTAYWDSAYFKTKFTGTSVKIVLGEGPAVTFTVIIDGKGHYLKDQIGIVDITPPGLGDGVHELIVIKSDSNWDLKKTVFKGLILDKNATTLPPTKKLLAEVVGDSITSGYGSTTHRAAQKLGMDAVNLGIAGITLTDGYTNYASSAKTGMSHQYFKLTNNLADRDGPEWNFTDYIPDVIMIMMGVNDKTLQVPEAVFQGAYIKFLEDVRQKNPNATIYVIRMLDRYPEGGGPLFEGYAAQCLAAVQARNSQGDKKVFYVNTSGFLTEENKLKYLADSTHPSDSGKEYLSTLLTDKILEINPSVVAK